MSQKKLQGFWPFQGRQRGQSLIETLLLSLALIGLIQFSFLLFWIFTNILWIEHQLYQSLLCSAEQRGISSCQHIGLKQIKRLSPPGIIRSLEIKKFQEEWRGFVHWRFYGKDFFIRQTLSLPQ